MRCNAGLRIVRHCRTLSHEGLHADADAIYLLSAYAKADREDLSPSDRKVLSRLVAEIKKEERNR